MTPIWATLAAVIQTERSISYGLDNADEFYIYTPGAPVSDLPYTFVLWTYALADMQNAETLPCYGIYNEGGGAGFIGMQ